MALTFPSDVSLASVAAAYAARDHHFHPREELQQRAERLERYMRKLGWYHETEATWHHRVQRRASEILMHSSPQKRVEEIWEEARRSEPRRLCDDHRVGRVLAAVAEGMPLVDVYRHFFNLEDLMFLGW